MRKDYVPAVAERAGLAFTSYESVAEGRLKLVDGKFQFTAITMKPTLPLWVNADAAKAKELIESRGELYDGAAIRVILMCYSSLPGRRFRYARGESLRHSPASAVSIEPAMATNPHYC